MPHAALPHEHPERLDGLAAHAAVLARDGDPALSALERHASTGCSACARALVNAREAQALLAAAAASAIAPGAALRERVLASASSRARVGAGAGAGAGAGEDAAAPLARGRDAARLRDPSATVAHLHLGDPGEAARAREVALLDALRAPRDSGEARALAALARLTGYPILFISVLQGERVGYRAQHGLPPELVDAPHAPHAPRAPQIRREMTFCTHCVSAGAPLVVEDAAREPFFRGSKMVQRFGLRAYMGVPLCTSTGVILGTLCALDAAPRPRDPRSLALLELFAEPIVAEIERGRDEAAAARRDALIERAAGGPPIHAAPWFARLLDLALTHPHPHSTARAVGETPENRPAALVTLAGPGAREAAAQAEAGEVVGRFLGDSAALGVLLAGADAAAAARAAAFRAACPDAGYALAGRTSAGTLRWVPAAPAPDVVDVASPGSA